MAIHYLRRGGLRSGQRVLVYGASGAAGTAAVRLARYAGAEVTGVCGPDNLELVTSLGAVAALDYTTVEAPPDGATYDLVLDAVGKRRSSPLKVACRRAVATGGTVTLVDDGTPGFSAADLAGPRGARGVGGDPGGGHRPGLPLERIVEAHRYVETDHKRGNVVITVA